MYDEIAETPDVSTSTITITLELDADIIAFFTKQSRESGQEMQECIGDLLQMYVEIQHKKQTKLENIEEIKRELTRGHG